MEEKIKVYVPESINNILLKDMELFEFYKKDRTLNRNDFYNTLIVNYYESYQADISDIYEHIKAVLTDSSDLEDYENADIADRILRYIESKTNRLEGPKAEVTLSIKPTRASRKAISYIQDCLLRNSTLSAYFRNLFASYVLLPQDKRERIIFREKFEVIEEAIENDRKIYFTLSANETPHIVSPYSLASSKEELFNYLLAEYNEKPFSFRITRLKKVVMMAETSSISEENEKIFQKMEKYGPQFSYVRNIPDEEIRVRMSERGKEMYEKMYVHRPVIKRIEGDVYVFDCSITQAYQYFIRFGRNALVEAPVSLQEDIRHYYASSLRAYRRYQNEDKENTL